MIKVNKLLSLVLISLLIIGNAIPVFADSINNYTKLQYITSTGTQYIDTGYIPNYNTSIYLEANGFNTQTGSMFGYRSSGSGFSLYTLGNSQGTVRWAYGNNTVNTINMNVLSGDFILTTNKNAITFFANNNRYDYSVASLSSGTAGGNLYIFKYNDGYPSSYNLKKFKILENDTIIHDFIPVKRNSDDVVGLYDLTTDTFFTNAGSGDFVAGPSIPTYTVSLSVSPNNSGSVSGGGIFYENDTTTITATPSTGYEFDEWSDGSTVNPRTLTVNSNVNLVATFRSIAPVTYTISLSVDPNGAGTVSGGGTYNAGSSTTISATANEGYVFRSWSDGNTANPRTITVNQNITLSANFLVIPSDGILISTSVNPFGSGYVTGGGYYEENDEITLTAVPNTGYIFVNWSDGETDNPRDITVTEEETYIANFELENPTPPVDNDSMTLLVLLVSFLIFIMLERGSVYNG